MHSQYFTELDLIIIKIALRISGTAVVSSNAIPETVLLSSLQFQVSYRIQVSYRTTLSPG